MLRFVTAGESHGQCLTGILEGLPAGLAVDKAAVDAELGRRQLGYGRGGRMKIERDGVRITAGVRHGLAIGSPIAFTVENRDWENWRLPMSDVPVPKGTDCRPVTHPRPGHADLAGALKYGARDVRNILERASARETAARGAAGAFCRLLLAHFGMRVGSHTLAVGPERVGEEWTTAPAAGVLALDPESPLRCGDAGAERRMIARIDAAASAGDTLGGISGLVAAGAPAGLGSYTQWDRRLDGRIAQAVMSIPAVKAVEIGCGVAGAEREGSGVHDAIFYDAAARRFFRKTNRAGGIEGGITNGEDVRVQIYVKPIPTLRRALPSVDIGSKQVSRATVERSDVCAVAAAGVVGEAMLAFVLAEAFLEKFGGDSIAEVERNYQGYLRQIEAY